MIFFSACSLKSPLHIQELEEFATKHKPKDNKIIKNIVYKSTLFHDLHLDLYQPLLKKYKKAPILIYIHGGSWLYGDKDLVNIYYKTVKTLRENGIAVVSIDYRFVTQSGVEAMIQDSYDAVDFLQKNAKKYALDSHKIGLQGHSAGANLALLTGFHFSKAGKDILFIVDEYGPTDINKLLKNKQNKPWWSHLLLESSLEKLSPVNMIHSNIPPVYISHGDMDTTVSLKQSQSLYRDLLANGTDVSLVVLKGANHSYKGIDTQALQLHRKEVLKYMLHGFAKYNPSDKKVGR